MLESSPPADAASGAVAPPRRGCLLAVETQAPREMAVCVLGEWGARYGLVAIVESFIVKAQAQQLATRR